MTTEIGRNGADTSLEGHFLIAMPGMDRDNPFASSVVYVCAHSAGGAMGFIVNKPQDIGFSSLLAQLDLIERGDGIRIAEPRDVSVCMGGPVEPARGFVLHSDDYGSDATIQVEDGLSLTSTMDVLKALATGGGPKSALMVLGYAGWGAGQLESEIAANGWLTCRAELDIVFDRDLDSKYARALKTLGVDPGFLTHQAGHA